MTANTNQGMLETALANSNFQQTASWSMVDIGKLAVQLPVGMLQRYAAGRVQPYTILTAEAMGTTFRLSAQGRKNVETAISQLPAIQRLGKSLEVGFGIEDVTRILARSEGGSAILAICAALKDCYSDDLAVEILLEYARATKAKESWMPSNMEWRALLDACAGSLARSTFSQRAEQLMRICGNNSDGLLYASEDLASSKISTCSAPQSIANALFNLSEIARGKATAITLIGGPDVGWIAAVSDFLLGLNVAISSKDTGEQLWRNFDDNQQCHLQIYFRSAQPMPEPGSIAATERQPVSQGDEQEVSSGDKRESLSIIMSIEDKTRLLRLEDFSELLQRRDVDFSKRIVSGRVEWRHALEHTFSTEFGSLMEIPSTFGPLLGCGMRIAQAFAITEHATLTNTLLKCTDYCDSSYGDGLLQTVVYHFPELSRLRKDMAAACRMSFSDAKAKYESCTSTVRSHCGCKCCRGDIKRFTRQHDGTMDVSMLSDSTDSLGSNDSLDTADSHVDHGERYCKVVIAETIIYICRLLSNVRLQCESLMPMRSGIELAYDRCRVLHTLKFLPGLMNDYFGPAVWWILAGEFWMAGDMVGSHKSTANRLSAILEIFTGRTSHHDVKVDMNVSAMWVNGFTAYLDLIKNDGCESLSDVNAINVMPGRIFYETKAYTRITDPPARSVLSQSHESAMNDIQLIWDVGNVFRREGLVIQQGPTDLRCRISLGAHSSIKPMTLPSFGPSAFASTLTSRRGLVVCKYRGRKACHKIPVSKQWKSIQVSGTQKSFEKDNMTVRFCPTESSQHFTALLSSSMAGTVLAATFIVDDECQECCLLHADRTPRPFTRQPSFIFLSVS